MPRPKGSKNKIQTGITYPRKCDLCGYISNNPSMYHYHKKTHNAIPQGTLCDHGCNQIATVINTNGKYTCKPIAHQCPEYIKQHSLRITEQWADPATACRKEETKKSLIKRLHNQETVDRIRKTLKEKWGDFTPEQMKDFRHYARRVRVRAQKWAKEQGYVLGQQTYHVDHKFSVWEAWKANLPESVVNHPANLEIMEAKANSSKGAKSSITLEELTNLIANTFD